MTEFRRIALRRVLSRNDGGVWGAEPVDDTGTVVLRSTDIALDGSWAIESPAARQLNNVEATAARLAAGDLVVVKSSGSAAHLGKTALVTEEVAAMAPCFANFVQRLRVAVDDVDARFAWYFLNSRLAAEQLDQLGTTTTGLRNISRDTLGALAFPFAPLPEQRVIADYLDRETARIDALIAAKRDQVSRLEERVDALVQEAIDRSRPDSLPLRRLVAVFVDYRGATPEKSRSGVPLITATNVKNGRINLALGEQFVTDETYTLWMRRGFPSVGDILITTEAPLGEVAAITDARVALAQRIILLKPNRARVVPMFLRVSLLSSRVQADLLSRASGSTVWGIRADRLRDVMVPLPDPAEQQRVVEISREAEQVSLVTRGLIDRQLCLLTERRQALITAAVTGRLVVPVAA